MDNLLMQKPQQLSDERIALYALIDRFEESIKTYQEEYASLVKKANGDIATREQQKSDILKKLAESHNKQKTKAETEHESRQKSYNKSIVDIKNLASKRTEDLESACRKSINDEQVLLNGKKNYDDSKIKTYKYIISEINKRIARVKTILGTSFSGESKYEKVSKSIKLTVASINDAQSAVTYLSKDIVDKAEALTKTVREITESLPKKIIYNKKQIAAIKELLELKKNAENALKIIEKDVHSSQVTRNNQFEQKSRSLREECNRNKQAIIEKKDKDLKNILSNIDAENNLYNNKMHKLLDDQKIEHEELKRHHEDQISGAKKNWSDKIQQLNKEFVKKMDTEYPADRMNAWINQFWYHPRNVEQYKMICDKENYNVLLGMAQIDISDWVSGATGKTVKNVLTKYITLFGRNKDQATQSYNNNVILLPYMISIENGDSVMLSHDEASGERAITILNSIAMRLLTSVSAGMMRFFLFDEVGYYSFDELKSIDPAKFSKQSMKLKSIVYGQGRNESEISSLLSELDNSFSRIEGQRSIYASIREFNQRNPLSKRIYQPVLMANYPSGLKNEGFKILNKIVSNCSKWGGTVFVAQPDNLARTLRPEFQDKKNDLDKKMLTFRLEKERQELVVLNPKFRSEKKARILLYGLPSSTVIEKDIVPDLLQRSIEASKIKINLTDAKDIFLPKEKWFKGNSDYGFSVPIGYDENGIPYELQFDDAHVNAIITGRVGSGKSNLVHALIMGTLLRYSPDEVKIFLIDFKNATDYSVYAKRYYLPSFNAISLADDPEFALSILEEIDKDIKDNRSGVITASDTKKIGSTNRKLCRVLLIIDELYVLAEKASDELRNNIMDKIDTLVHQSRAFGVHTVICGQDLNKLERYDTIMKQCTSRIALHCSDEQVQDLFGEKGIEAMHSIDSDDRGTAVFSSDGGKTFGKERTVLVEDAKQLQILNEISEHYLAEGRRDKTKIVHSKIKDNPNNPLQLFVSHGIAQYEGICVGEPIVLGGSNLIRPTGNLWIIGGNANENSYCAAQSAVFFSLYSILLNKIKYKNISIICSNCSDTEIRNIDEEEKDLFGQLSSSCSQFIKYDKGDEIIKTLDMMHDEVDRRKNDPHRCKNAIWWFVVRPEMIINNLSQSFIMDFKELLTVGEKYNVHIVLWNYDIKQAQDLQISRTLFSERICLEMNSEDLRLVNGSEMKPVPCGYKVSIVGTSTKRIRVFDLPEGLWMNQLFSRLNSLTN